MRHFWRMLLGCLVPVLLIFVLSIFGVNEGVTLTVFIVLMLGCHLLMIPGHDAGHNTQPMKETIMQNLDIMRFGFAVAVASAVSYLGCVLVMLTVPRETAIPLNQAHHRRCCDLWSGDRSTWKRICVPMYDHIGACRDLSLGQTTLQTKRG